MLLTRLALVGALVGLTACQQLAVLAPAAGATAGTTQPGGAAAEVDWAALERRPLRLPTIIQGAPCPRAMGRQVDAAYGPALGDGPLYAVGLGAYGVLGIARGGDFAGSAWGGNKVLWLSSPAYRGPALIRGRQLNGPDPVRFERGDRPPAELRFPLHTGVGSAGTERGWRELPSYTRLRVPGCYAYQVDGIGFTETIVFDATAG